MNVQYSAASRKWSPPTHLYYYFVNLLIADLIQSISKPLSLINSQTSDDLINY